MGFSWRIAQQSGELLLPLIFPRAPWKARSRAEPIFSSSTTGCSGEVRLLIENDIAVYSSHLPLDRHPILGNNVLLAEQLGLTPNGVFGRFEDIFIGVSGDSDIDTASLIESARVFANDYGEIRTSRIPPGRRTKRWGICTGAGASAETLNEASAVGIDTLIVGEGPHWTAIHAEEHDLAIIYAGHYATETIGVRALLVAEQPRHPAGISPTEWVRSLRPDVVTACGKITNLPWPFKARLRTSSSAP